MNLFFYLYSLSRSNNNSEYARRCKHLRDVVHYHVTFLVWSGSEFIYEVRYNRVVKVLSPKCSDSEFLLAQVTVLTKPESALDF